MSRGGKGLIAALLILMLPVVAFFYPGWWLPSLASFWLPATTTLSLEGRPGWEAGGVRLPAIHYRVKACELAAVSGPELSYKKGRWWLHARQVEIDSTCFSQLPDTPSQPAAPRSLAEWQAMLPNATVTVDRFLVSPWQTWAGSLKLNVGDVQQITWQGKSLSFQATLKGQQLNLQSLTLTASPLTQPVKMSGTLRLPDIPDSLPASGVLNADLALQQIPEPLKATLRWQQDRGELTLHQVGETEPLVRLPWQVSAEQISIHQGEWRWPYASQPISGGIALALRYWQKGLSATEIAGRLNVLTQGRGGKGNVVLTLGPGHLDWADSDLPFRLTGESKFAQLLFFAGIPGNLRGPLSDPVLRIKPGAILRMRGRLLSTMEVDEARWPLSGISVSSAGISGQLQAILSAHDRKTGRFRLHLDGRASDFWPDKGEWRWRYWGDGVLAPLAAKWDVKGRGRWQDQLIELESLSTGFNQINYGGVNIQAPALGLAAPVRWQRDERHPAFTGKFRLKAQQTHFSNGGYLAPATLLLAVQGSEPAAFQFKGDLAAPPAGPIKIRGRWDGERLRGQAWWPRQTLTAFQSLLSEDSKMKIQGGTLRAQVAFSAASEGFTAGGHWVVRDGSLWMPDNSINGIDFSLPFRLKDNQWYFGTKGPVLLRIAEVKNQFALHNVTADLQGWYPWNTRQPLRLTNASVDVLGGKMSLLSLEMPQREAATLRLKNISMSELITAIKPKQIAMSGYINASLPVWADNPDWLVKGGWIANNGPMTVRLDKDFADTLAANNIAAGAAINWLRYMEISRSWATLDITRRGEMSLKAQVNGTSLFSDKHQRVSLNYTQQENLFQLWRSLRYGDNLQLWLEQNATLPSQQGKTLNELPSADRGWHSAAERLRSAY